MKNLKVLGIIVLVVVLGAGGWFFTVKQSRNNADLMQNNAEVKNENQREEQQVVKKNNQKQGEEKVEELKIENTKDTKPKFGIDDSGLKYNTDGSVDMSDWKKYKVGAVQFKYPQDWYEIDFGVSNNPTQEINPLDKQIEIKVNGQPIDVDVYSCGDNADSESWCESALKEAIKWEIDDFKKNSYNCKEKALSNKGGLTITCLEKKSSMFIRKYIKISKVKEHSWDSRTILIIMKNKDILEKNRKIIDAILSSVFIFNEKYTE